MWETGLLWVNFSLVKAPRFFAWIIGYEWGNKQTLWQDGASYWEGLMQHSWLKCPRGSCHVLRRRHKPSGIPRVLPESFLRFLTRGLKAPHTRGDTWAFLAWVYFNPRASFPHPQWTISSTKGQLSCSSQDSSKADWVVTFSHSYSPSLLPSLSFSLFFPLYVSLGDIVVVSCCWKWCNF